MIPPTTTQRCLVPHPLGQLSLSECLFQLGAQQEITAQGVSFEPELTRPTRSLALWGALDLSHIHSFNGHSLSTP